LNHLIVMTFKRCVYQLFADLPQRITSSCFHLYSIEQALAGTMDAIVDTTPGGLTPMSLMLNLLKFDGTVVMVGAPERVFDLPVAPLILGNYRLIISFVSNFSSC
jgi:D-arabinose 1-dehydrogenase-like Zn-dependent alcohol dehydrogenase